MDWKRIAVGIICLALLGYGLYRTFNEKNKEPPQEPTKVIQIDKSISPNEQGFEFIIEQLEVTGNEEIFKTFFSIPGIDILQPMKWSKNALPTCGSDRIFYYGDYGLCISPITANGDFIDIDQPWQWDPSINFQVQIYQGAPNTESFNVLYEEVI